MTQFCNHKGKYTWWEKDKNCIPIVLVCEDCRDAKLSAYQGNTPTDPRYTEYQERYHRAPILRPSAI